MACSLSIYFVDCKLSTLVFATDHRQLIVQFLVDPHDNLEILDTQVPVSRVLSFLKKSMSEIKKVLFLRMIAVCSVGCMKYCGTRMGMVKVAQVIFIICAKRDESISKFERILLVYFGGGSVNFTWNPELGTN